VIDLLFPLAKNRGEFAAQRRVILIQGNAEVVKRKRKGILFQPLLSKLP